MVEIEEIIGIYKSIQMKPAAKKDEEFVKKVLSDDSLTYAEKILSLKRIDEDEKIGVKNEIIVAAPDFTMATDGTGPLAIDIFNELGGGDVFDPNRVLLVSDHTFPPSNEKVSLLQLKMRKFAFERGIHYTEGNICHQYLFEVFDVPGMLLLGADSHTVTAGSVGAFGTGVGSTEVASIWKSGSTWMRIPPSFKIVINGEMPNGVYSKDLILHIIGEVTIDGATYMSVEFTGSTVKELSAEARATMSNMSVEMGAKAGIFPPDEQTQKYLDEVGRKPMYWITPGKEAEYDKEMYINTEKLEPVVAAPYSPGNVKPISDVEGMEIQQAFLGSCTNARPEDLFIAAQILKNALKQGKKVNPHVRFIVTPASRRVYYRALKEGLINLFLEFGAIVTNPTCGACVGTHLGILASKEVAISTSNRNFIGRMGARDSEVYLASPATVAASAIEGKITDPRKYL